MYVSPQLGPPVLSPRRREEFRAIFDYEAQPKEWVSGTCSLCGLWDKSVPQRIEDRFGYLVNVDTCKCGLVYLSKRMTAEAYSRFYESGVYRKLLTAFYGREIGPREIRAQQRAYGKRLAEFLAPHVFKLNMEGHKPRTVLDVGGSTGVIARKMAGRFGVVPTILDPAVEELALAEGERIVSTAEAFEPGERKWDLIVMCQTVDHLLDIAGTLKKLRGCLSEHGLFWVDAVDTQVRNYIKIDHPFYLTEKTMAEFLKRAGFREIARGRPWDRAHVGFLCGR